MEETLKSMQGVQTNKSVDISSLCFFPNIQLPHKFKLPEFDKYNGIGCPYAHLTMYCRKMAPYANNEKLMIHYFQDSLTGPADAWFSTLDKSKVKSWHDLTYNFMKQYEYNTSLAPNREDLQKAKKKRSENFKEFAQRWSGLADRVQPPLTDHELSNLFIKSTKGPYCEKLITCVNCTFAQLVIVGEQVEDGIKSRIIMDYQAMKSLLEQYQNDSSGASSSKKLGQNQKKEDENGSIRSIYKAYGRNKQARGQFDTIGLVTPIPMVPVKTPFPTWYNPQARCEYHNGGVGHDLENCLALRHGVQDLIEANELQIASEPELVGPNITKNSLPTHDG
ncbi:hypothetical protein SLEP1_g20085 [Rubroshorea leprosula]|uniref:Retrotransposon gag domain-containing protein n=1 Tax=Rubroshorea leprosula TaxID=152421 RepID=A0AAV5JAQ1_9ROSI|nr:hypothetical protein SLEP1_g20085 [Rubroshorea leprosula]